MTSKFKGKCHYCKETGHWYWDCKARINHNQQNQEITSTDQIVYMDNILNVPTSYLFQDIKKSLMLSNLFNRFCQSLTTKIEDIIKWIKIKKSLIHLNCLPQDILLDIPGLTRIDNGITEIPGLMRIEEVPIQTHGNNPYKAKITEAFRQQQEDLQLIRWKKWRQQNRNKNRH